MIVGNKSIMMVIMSRDDLKFSGRNEVVLRMLKDFSGP